MANTILVVDDESSIRDMLRFSLELEGFKVQSASNAHKALKIISNEKIDLILLDWMMPGLSGIDLAAQLHKCGITNKTGIIMLTAKNEEADVIRGLETGADDYIAKPFTKQNLIARIRTVLRRMEKQNGKSAHANEGPIVVDEEQYRIYIDGDTADFSPTEFKLMRMFIQNPKRAYSRDQLLDQVWGSQVYVDERTVDVHIRRVRKILKKWAYDGCIETVRGLGYRWQPPGS